jgi:ribosomal protein S18 acetylase RimI-like enzyme
VPVRRATRRLEARPTADVRATIGDARVRTWVAEVDHLLGGFASARFGPAADIGEIVMLAVDPECQRQGIATELTATATTWLAIKTPPW